MIISLCCFSVGNGKRLYIRNDLDYNYYYNRWKTIFRNGNGDISSVIAFSKELGWDFEKNNNRIIHIYEKPEEVMTEEERDQYYKSFSGLTYAEFGEKHKNDTVESVMQEVINRNGQFRNNL